MKSVISKVVVPAGRTSSHGLVGFFVLYLNQFTELASYVVLRRKEEPTPSVQQEKILFHRTLSA